MDYDGFYFTHNDIDPVNYDISFFTFKDDMVGREKIDYTELGDMYHVAFFKMNMKTSTAEFDGEFEAIFRDPICYIENLVGSDIFGLFVRKTDKSAEYFNDYLTSIRKQIMMINLIQTTKSIAKSK